MHSGNSTLQYCFYLAHHQLPVESKDQHCSPPSRRHNAPNISLVHSLVHSHNGDNEQCQSPAQAKKDDIFLGTDTRHLMVAGQTGTSGQEHSHVLFTGERSHGKLVVLLIVK